MFENDEIELIHSLWVDTSQDPEYISEETGIDIKKVMEILELLSKQGKIKNFKMDESKILLYEELLDLDDYFELGLDKISTSMEDTDYFFSDIDLNKRFSKPPFTIFVKSKHLRQDFIVMDSVVTYLDRRYPMLIYVDRLDRVYFQTPSQPKKIDEFMESLSSDKSKFYGFCDEILDEIIPFDFWETRDKFN